MLTRDNILSEKANIRLPLGGGGHLRIIEEQDVTEAYVDWLNDYEIVKFTEQRFYDHTYSGVCDFVRAKAESKVDLLFGIFVWDRHIGNVKLGPIKWEHKSAEISYFVGEKSYWGKGLGTQAVGAAVQYGFKTIGLEKINAGYYAPNVGSACVLKKIGFTVEGVRHSDVFFEGERVDNILVGLAR